jgi:hypothetical protein
LAQLCPVRLTKTRMTTEKTILNTNLGVARCESLSGDSINGSNDSPPYLGMSRRAM